MYPYCSRILSPCGGLLQDKRSPNRFCLTANLCMGALFFYSPKNEYWTSPINTSLTAHPKYALHAPISRCAEVNKPLI